jgi:hypothetical protein
VILKKYTIGMLLIDLLILFTGYLLVSQTEINLHFSDIVLLTFCFSAINLLSFYIFFRGLKKDPGSQTMHILVAIVLKMPLEMVLALIWFFVAEKTYTSALILFFILYLALSLYSILLMLNTLKNKPL